MIISFWYIFYTSLIWIINCRCTKSPGHNVSFVIFLHLVCGLEKMHISLLPWKLMNRVFFPNISVLKTVQILIKCYSVSLYCTYNLILYWSPKPRTFNLWLICHHSFSWKWSNCNHDNHSWFGTLTILLWVCGKIT